MSGELAIDAPEIDQAAGGSDAGTRAGRDASGSERRDAQFSMEASLFRLNSQRLRSL